MELEQIIQFETQKEAPKQKLGGVFYWMVLGVAIIKDSLDLLVTFFFFAGNGIGVPLSITLVGIPLLALAWITWGIALIFGFFIWFIIVLYFWMNDGTMGLRIAGKLFLRLFLFGLSFIIEGVPGLDVLPLTTLVFVISVRLENMIRGGGVKGKIIEKYVEYARGGKIKL